MEKLWFRFAVAVLVASLCMAVSCGDDDDDDDDDDSGDDDDDGGSTPNPNCAMACDGMFDCGGQLWYEDKDECLEYCNDWAQSAVDCADCFFGCFEDDASCLSATACLVTCAGGACLEELEELDDYWTD